MGYGLAIAGDDFEAPAVDVHGVDEAGIGSDEPHLVRRQNF
ncbi:hypothetical protein OCL97_10385 [Phenylobacterium sp. HK31G]|uniref:Uncharacterized protein n=1 Tax=Phenylobacterium ferrooxidans TaxID=2982689 RepID=A0ABW6CRC5_9CAUL